MTRAGRPRKQGSRYKNGRLKAKKDVGTEELRAKKRTLHFALCNQEGSAEVHIAILDKGQINDY